MKNKNSVAAMAAAIRLADRELDKIVGDEIRDDSYFEECRQDAVDIAKIVKSNIDQVIINLENKDTYNAKLATNKLF